jgi:hypothetical protein
VHSRSTCTKPVAVAPRRAVGGLAGPRRCMAAPGAACTGVRPALAGLRGSATGTIAMASARRRPGPSFGQCAT